MKKLFAALASAALVGTVFGKQSFNDAPQR